jgi:hypothetical protein
LAFCGDLIVGLIKHRTHLSLEERQGLGEIGGAQHQTLQALQLVVEFRAASLCVV